MKLLGTVNAVCQNDIFLLGKIYLQKPRDPMIWHAHLAGGQTGPPFERLAS